MEDLDSLENSRLILVGATTSVQIWHDDGANWRYVRWRGPYEPKTAQVGWALLLQGLHQQPCARVLNDARYASAWPGQEQWAGEALFPTLAQAGVQYVACVYPEGLPGRVSLEMTLRNISNPFVASFEDLASVCSWLQQWPTD